MRVDRGSSEIHASHWLRAAAACVLLLQFFGGSAAANERWFYQRNHNPFLQVYGLPPFQAAALAADGEIQYRTTLDVANHAGTGSLNGATAEIDGESYYFTLSIRHGVSDRLEIGFDLPFTWHANGIFDNAIEGWHDLFGLSNSKRTGPSNQLRFQYDAPGIAPYDLSSPVSGLGDIQLTAAVPLFDAAGTDRRALSLRASLKLPTGDEAKLLGSGATDLALGLYASQTGILSLPDLSLTGFAGILLLGEGDILPEIQQRTVGFGGLAAAWQMTERLSVAAQFYGQGNYLDSVIDDVGGNSIQATFGGTYDMRRHRMSLSLAIVEDVFTDATTDVAMHLSVRWHGVQ